MWATKTLLCQLAREVMGGRAETRLVTLHIFWLKSSPKLKCQQNLNLTKTQLSPKVNCHQHWIVTKTKLSPKLKCHQALKMLTIVTKNAKFVYAGLRSKIILIWELSGQMTTVNLVQPTTWTAVLGLPGLSSRDSSSSSSSSSNV